MGSLSIIMENYLKRTNSFIRFLLVGILNTMIGFSIMLFLLNIAGMSYWFSTAIGNCIGAAVSYILNRSFTFQSSAHVKSSVPRFLFVIIGCYVLSYSLSRYIFVNLLLIPNSLHLAENFAVAFGMGIYTILNYYGQKYYVFKKQQ